MANFLFVLRSEDNEKATRCFQFAKIAADKGHTVTLFGRWRGVVGHEGSRREPETVTGDCPADYIPALVEKGIEVGVCIPCAKGRNLNEADFHATMKLDGGPHLIDVAAEAKVFNF